MNSDDVEGRFDRAFDEAFRNRAPDFGSHVNVALVGKVSAGKSSLLNALFHCSREDAIAEVGGTSGVTTEVKAYPLDDKVLIVDCPGLNDVKEQNSDLTAAFLRSIDLGLFVVTGSADSSQKENFDDLRSKADQTLVVLNKVDEWDDLEEAAVDAIEQQWKDALGTDRVFRTCTKGFDPKSRHGIPMDIRGVDDLRDEIFQFLKKSKKDILLAKHLKSKGGYALAIIAAALVAVAGEAFIPGSAVYITATQAAAISGLAYLYTGEVLSKEAAVRVMLTFAAQSTGTTIFLWAKSFLPPTGVVDVVAAGIAVTITFAMLATVKWMLENGHALTDRKELNHLFKLFKMAAPELATIKLSDLKDKKALIELLARILKRAMANGSKGTA